MGAIGAKRWMVLSLLLAAATASAQPGEAAISVSGDACAAVAHLNDAPGVAYQPGVDVHGKAVAPADLPGSRNEALNEQLSGFPIKITVDLQKRFGIPKDAKLFQGESKIGYVDVRDGKAYLNGQPLSTPEQGLLAAACKEQRK